MTCKKFNGLHVMYIVLREKHLDSPETLFQTLTKRVGLNMGLSMGSTLFMRGQSSAP